MANCQNNMRYGRQMNQNNCRNMPVNNNNNYRPASSMPDCRQRTPEPCGCQRPEPHCPSTPEHCGCQKPEPCGCQKPEPCGCQKPESCRTPKPEHCGCQKKKPCECRYDVLEDFPIAMAYVPWQKWQNIYETCEGFQRGTIFEDLSKPFLGRGGCNR